MRPFFISKLISYSITNLTGKSLHKMIRVLFLGLTALSLVGCTAPSHIITDQTIGLTEDITSDIISDVMDSIGNYEDYEDSKQQQRHELRVFDAKNNYALRTITDFDICYRYVEKITGIILQEVMSLNKLSSIPGDAVPLYTCEFWEKDLDNRPDSEDNFIQEFVTTLYQNTDGYYLFIQFSEELAEGLNDFFPDGQLSAALSESMGQLFADIAQGNELSLE